MQENFIIEVSVSFYCTHFYCIDVILFSYSLFLHGLILCTIQRPKSTDPTQRPQSRSSRRPREIVLPTPLIGTLLNPSNVQKPNEAAVRQWRNDGPLSPDSHNTRPHFIHSSVSNTSVPGIEIVTPVIKLNCSFITLLTHSLVLPHFVTSLRKNRYRSRPSYTRKC
jgi:hypothetical protein